MDKRLIRYFIALSCCMVFGYCVVDGIQAIQEGKRFLGSMNLGAALLNAIVGNWIYNLD